MSSINADLTKKRNLNTDIGRHKEASCGHEEGHPSANERGLGLSPALQPQKEPPMPILMDVAKLQSCETIHLRSKSYSLCLFV